MYPKMRKRRKKDTDNSKKWRFLCPKIKKSQKRDTFFRHWPDIFVSEKCKFSKKGHKIASNAGIPVSENKEKLKKDTLFRHSSASVVSENTKSQKRDTQAGPRQHLRPLPNIFNPCQTSPPLPISSPIPNRPSPGYDKITHDGAIERPSSITKRKP